MFHENSHDDKGATEGTFSVFCVLQNRFWGNVSFDDFFVNMHKCLSTSRIYRLDKKLQENGCLLGKRQKGPHVNVALSPKSIAHKVVVSRTLYFTVYKPQLVYA